MLTKIFDVLSSTNDELKKLLNPEEDVLYIAREQSGGRGSKGRSFICERGGIYMSLLRLYPCKARESFKLMTGAATAVVKALETVGIDAEIKWPNDIFYGGKKLCGILIENVFEGDEVARSVIGIGLNVNNPIADEIADIATSVELITGNKADIECLIKEIVSALYSDFPFEEYKRKSCILGKRITVVKGEEKFVATAEDILPDGSLLLDSGEVLSAAEVSIR